MDESELFSEDYSEKKIIIYDNTLQFESIDYSWFDIKDAATDKIIEMTKFL